MPRKRRNPVTDDQIVSAYERLRSMPKVSDELKVGTGTIGRVLTRRGIERTGLNEYRKTMSTKWNGDYRGKYDGPIEPILEMYAKGMSMRVIAGHIGRSVRIVHRIVNEAEMARPQHASGPLSAFWEGGRNTDGNGYYKVWVAPDDPMAVMRDSVGYVKEHRLVLARKLGRPLMSKESVHHINGKRDDNRPANLQLRQGQHGKHLVMCCLDCGSRNVGPVAIAEPGE